MNRGRETRRVIWASSKPLGVEYCKVENSGPGWLLGGTVVRRFKEGTGVITYSIQTDAGWTTRKVSVEQLLKGKASSVELETRESRWFVNGMETKRLRGCVDVDLQASPVTNTLPIKRVRPKIGEKVLLTAAWVRFPELKVEPLQQSYERRERTKYLYRSGGFKSEIETDGFGLVTRYGDYWLALRAPAPSWTREPRG